MSTIRRIVANWVCLVWTALFCQSTITWLVALFLIRGDLKIFHILVAVAAPVISLLFVLLFGLSIAAESDKGLRDFRIRPFREVAIWGSLPVVVLYWLPRGMWWLAKKIH